MADQGELKRLLESQRTFFQTRLKGSSASERIAKLRKLRKWMFQHQQDIHKALYADMHKPAHECDVMEILPVSAEINDAIANLREWMRPKRVSTPLVMIGSSAMVHYEPKGCSLILGPFNYPFMLTVGPLVSAIAAGCSAIIKPSEFTPATSKLVKSMCESLFVPEEVSCVLGDHHLAQGLTALPFDHIFFTGSPAVGKKVMHAAADNLASVTLELGGRNPVIVDETAAIGDTARKLVWGKFVNGGASCMSPNYILVHEKIHASLVEAVKQKINAYYGSSSLDREQSPNLTHVVSKQHISRLQELVDRSVGEGAVLVTGGEAKPEDKYFPPTVLDFVSLEHAVFQDEIFGPVMCFMRYNSLDDALALVNSIEKPLAVYIFSRSSRHIERVVRETSSGTVMVNETTVAFGHSGLPFGGVNFSGIGKAHGHAGFLAFTNEKPVMRQNRLLPFTMLVWPPYTGIKRKLINFVMRYF